MADSSPAGDQPRATTKDIAGRDTPSLQYKTTIAKPMRRIGRTTQR